jgi:HEPN domain-containing protein
MNRRGSDKGLREERAFERSSQKLKRPRTSLHHLPVGKQEEIAWVRRLIFEEFARAISQRKAEGIRDGKILKLILHGAYTSGAWVDDPAGVYFADFEFLVVVSNDRLADVGEFWSDCERKLLFAAADRVHLRTQVRLSIQSLDAINGQIEQGTPYFKDILERGVLLHDTPGHPFSQYGAPRSEDLEADAELHLEEGMALLEEFLGSAKLSIANRWCRKAAFDLHQATERLYNIVLLVFTGYTPHTHNLVQLRRLAEPLDKRLHSVWPSDLKEQRRCFELLRGAYIKARYNRYYRVTDDELRWLQGQVEYFVDLVDEICWERIEGLSRERRAERLSVREPTEQIIANYFAARAMHPGPIVDQRLLPHSKSDIKEAILTALRETDDLETVRKLTEGFVGLADWLLVNDEELAVLEAKERRAVESNMSHASKYRRLANRVAANTIVLGAELGRAMQRTSRATDRM